jgi:hypothetical protein
VVGKSNVSCDWLREHWRRRRNRVLEELRGTEAGLEVLPNTPEGGEVRTITETKIEELGAKLREIEGYLGSTRQDASSPERG